ncbi:FIST signal transduction protein [Ciceribacter sp. RN22]|uniref:FIST signal transduction protein n=1 Tax=Ciceribacter sp. RN22 TaxID=2954932 RepID=UPI002093590B|nr:FIST N-terminal domain-containing protein [Ciceribacter sp. RN22]MCO6177020.1 FIST C-terminal domain-containing protein [Ciceribacter sp. RN22]
MQIRTAQSCTDDPARAVEDIAAGLEIGRHGPPDFVALHFAIGMPAEALAPGARRLAGAVHGGSSCLGIMSQTGVDIDSGSAVGALAIWDRAGSYGTASAELGADVGRTARLVTEAALAAAGRSGEVPDLVWLTVAPGREELVIAGIRAVVGSRTPIVGGSAADNDVSGKWTQFGPLATHADGVVISVLFPSTPLASAYQSGYAPTGESGRVTRVEGRRLREIDGRPAAEVYHRWTGHTVPMAGAEPLSILAASTLWPLGRVTRDVAGVPFHLLAHPAVAHPDGSLDLFADVAEGDCLWQMQGSADSLVARAGRVAGQARDEAGGELSGALVVFCGGCMLAVRHRMDEVRAGINAALGDVPWLGMFTFGEQGVPTGRPAKHSNLMISCTTFVE